MTWRRWIRRAARSEGPDFADNGRQRFVNNLRERQGPDVNYPVGTDFEWFATDRNGHVARFTTCGLGSIPTIVLEHDEHYDASGARFGSLPRHCAAELLVSFPKPDDFKQIAEAGLFAYDYRDGRYELVARPSVPLNLNDLNYAAKTTVELVRLAAAAFATDALLPELTDTEFVGPHNP